MSPWPPTLLAPDTGSPPLELPTGFLAPYLPDAVRALVSFREHTDPRHDQDYVRDWRPPRPLDPQAVAHAAQRLLGHPPTSRTAARAQVSTALSVLTFFGITRGRSLKSIAVVLRVDADADDLTILRLLDLYRHGQTAVGAMTARRVGVSFVDQHDLLARHGFHVMALAAAAGLTEDEIADRVARDDWPPRERLETLAALRGKPLPRQPNPSRPRPR